MDRIRLVGIEAQGFHGLLEQERRDGQTFLPDVELELDLDAAGRTDDIAATVNYAWLSQAVHDILVGPPFDLIETVAHRCLDVAMSDDRVVAASVTINKPDAPHSVAVANTQVTLRRAR